MRKLSNIHFLFALVCLVFIGKFNTVDAQQKLIHYWHFDGFDSKLTTGVDPLTLVPIHANWSSLDSTKAVIAYVPAAKLSNKYLTYWDNNAGDLLNARGAAASRATANQFALRVRNPSDSMQLLFVMPTTKYKNITLSFETEKSSLTSGMGKQVFDYSVDGGKNWRTSGLSIPSDSLTTKNWGLISVSLAGDIAVNDNPDFVFKIKFKSLNTGTSGNNRFDNVTLEGDSANGTTPPPGQKLIHYWDFNHFKGLSAPGSPSLILPVNANWSALDTTKALISYVPAYKVSSKYLTYWDTYPVLPAESDKNARRGSSDGNSLRVRNPSDSMQLLFAMPTLHYKNITLKYAIEKSSLTSGQGKEVFDYSVDSGKNWKTTGLSITSDSETNITFNLVTIKMAADTMINNNPDFVFRILFKTQNSGTSGNSRFDNVTLEGDTDLSKTPNIFTAINAYNSSRVSDIWLYPNPAGNSVTIETSSKYPKTISMLNIQGQAITETLSENLITTLDLSTVKPGIYFIKVQENESGRISYLKLVRN